MIRTGRSVAAGMRFKGIGLLDIPSGKQRLARVGRQLCASGVGLSKPTTSASISVTLRVRCWFGYPTVDATKWACYPTHNAILKPSVGAMAPYRQKKFVNKYLTKRAAIAAQRVSFTSFQFLP